MNIRDLEYVVAVAEEAHFGRAAARCNVSQPALSGQIKKLEERLGVVFFERTNRRVAITPVGAEIVAKAKRLLLIAEEIESTAQTFADPLAGPMRVGTIPTIGPYLFPCILRPLKEALPKVQFSLTEDITENLERRVRDGELDVAVTATELNVTGVDETTLYSEPFWVALPGDHALASRKPIDVKNLNTEELLLLRDGHCLSDQVAVLCGLTRRQESGLDTQASSLATISGLVAAGAGITLLPASAVADETGARTGITVAPTKNKGADRLVRLIHRETYPKRELLTAMANVIRNHLPDGVSAV